MKPSILGTSLLLITASQLVGADTPGQISDANSSTVSASAGTLEPSSTATVARPLISSDVGTLLVGQGLQVFSGCSVLQANTFHGFGPFGQFMVGSYSPTGLTDGHTVAAVYDSLGSCAGGFSFLSVSGFSSNPGSAWLSSITCNGVTNNASNAFFFYSAGSASWTWNQLFGLLFKNGSNVSCTITHN